MARERKFQSAKSFLFGGLQRKSGDLDKIENLGVGGREKDLTVSHKRQKATWLIIERWSTKQDRVNKRKKRDTLGLVFKQRKWNQKKSLQKHPRVQAIGLGEAQMFGNKRIFAESLTIDLRIKIKFSLKELKVEKNGSEVRLEDLIDLTGLCNATNLAFCETVTRKWAGLLRHHSKHCFYRSMLIRNVTTSIFAHRMFTTHEKRQRDRERDFFPIPMHQRLPWLPSQS